jgi:1-deoxyxylulose-5-phosphate synthase
MARGRLTRRLDAPSSSNRIAGDQTAVAQAAAIPRAQVALAWVVLQPGVSAPIIGGTKSNHLDEAIDALSVRLTSEDCAALECHYVPHPASFFREAQSPVRGDLVSV